MHGVLFIDKMEGCTSRDVVNQICKIYGTKKVGHTGTLDPMATGVLVVCLGKYTKLVEELSSKEKEYIATMKLGIKTNTGDITGSIVEQRSLDISPSALQKAFDNFPRTYLQTVPIYSAVKVQGKKLYEYAREGSSVLLPQREVEIKELELLHVNNDLVTFRCVVSKGTYIRSLIEDIASSLGNVATMQSLKRTKQGNICIEQCLQLNDITKDIPLKHIEDLFHYSKLEVDDAIFQKIQNGNKLSLASNKKRLFLTYHEKVLAIYEKSGEEYRLIFKDI